MSHRLRIGQPQHLVLWVTAVIVGALLLLAGCTSADPTTRAAPKTMDWARLPLAGYAARHSLTQAEAIVATTQAAIRASITACMTQGGYQYDSPRQPAAEQTVLLNSLSRAPSVRAARQRGLNLSTAFRQRGGEALPTPADPELTSFNNYLDALSPTEHATYNRKLSACTNTSLSPLTESKGSLLERLKDSYDREVLSTAVLGRARESWRSCMTARGNQAATVGDLLSQLRPKATAVVQSIDTNSTTGAPKPAAVADLWRAERAAAVDQAECDITAYGPVVGQWSAREHRWERLHAADVDALNDQLRLAWTSIVGL